jgi:hypothetical protein
VLRRNYAEQTIIAFDVETVPDLWAAARMLGLGTASEAEVREALGPGFPKHPLHIRWVSAPGWRDGRQ